MKAILQSKAAVVVTMPYRWSLSAVLSQLSPSTMGSTRRRRCRSSSGRIHGTNYDTSVSSLSCWTTRFSSSVASTIVADDTAAVDDSVEEDVDDDDVVVVDTTSTTTTTTTTTNNNNKNTNAKTITTTTSVVNNNNNNNSSSSSSASNLLTADALRIPTWTPSLSLYSTNPTTTPESEILASYNELLQERTSCHFGYPYNLQLNYYQELGSFLQYSINNLGDPYIPSNYGVHSRQFEIAVIDYFAQLWKMDGGGETQQGVDTTQSRTTVTTTPNSSTGSSSYWGYVTASGTEGNLHGILLARECFPDGILYTSQETHYSIFKAARYYRMECQIIPTLPNGEINYDILATTIRQQTKQNDAKPMIFNINIGTTVKGAIDNIDRIVQILHQENIPRDKFYIHCDGALFALMIPFLTTNSNVPHTNQNNHSNHHATHTPIPEISFATQPIDSIAVSGHKMLGCPMPCGVALCRKEHITRLGQPIDYLNSIDTTIMGSRNGHAALYLWYALRTKGSLGLQQDVQYCIEMAQYLRHRLVHDMNLPCGLNEYSSTVVLERPVDVSLIQKWQLACSDDIAHIVVMPNITVEQLEQFLEEFRRSIQIHGRIQPTSIHSPLSQLQSELW